MPSSFKGIDIFGSGPHRFAVGAQGSLVVSNLSLGAAIPGSVPLGPLELDITVRGRLIATSESALWTLRDAITSQLIHPPTGGTLIDLHGRTWLAMSFVRYEEDGPTDRGRAWSIGYRALFRRFDTPP